MVVVLPFNRKTCGAIKEPILSMSVTAVILAAGHGTRMKSSLPKVMHPLAGKALIEHALDNAAAAASEKPVVVVSPGADRLRDLLGDRARFAVQNEQLGTAHALQCAETLFSQQAAHKSDRDLLLVLLADMPLYRPETLQSLVAAQQANPGPISMLTVVAEDARGFGRIVRDENGAVSCIVEEAHATPEQLAIREYNVSAYCFDADWIWPALKRIKVSPKGEYYLTDVVELAYRDGLRVAVFQMDDPEEAIGINTQVHLAEAERILRRRINQHWMLAGVTMIDPLTTYVEAGVSLEPETVLWPNTHLRGSTQVGQGCKIGPNTILIDAHLEAGCTVLASYLSGIHLAAGTTVGPYRHEDEPIN
jgi:bifunctional UDP-N-acetylglucosamine pyrophosphorylase/glucosamine-1-phosphate N-acetyltransferase